MKITVVTAAFNSEATIADTLRSVLHQEYHNVEHIVVDGGSSDATMSIVKSFATLYNSAGKTLIWRSEPDSGIYEAMNKGIALAQGDVVGLLNSDDFFTTPQVLQTVAKVLSEDSVDAVYGDIHFVNPENLTRPVRYYSSRSFARWKMRLGFMPAHPSFYCRRMVYERFGAFTTSLKEAADFENLLRLIFVNRIDTRYLGMDFVTMRTGGASTRGWRSHRRALADHMEAYRLNGVWSCIPLELLRYASKFVALQIWKLRHFH